MARTVYLKTCQQCSTIFPYPKGLNHPGKYCSWDCRNAAMSRKVTLTCVKCSVEFDVKPSEAKTRKFCSQQCRIQRPDQICEQCGASFRVKPYRVGSARFCSTKCMGERRYLGNHPHDKRIRQSTAYKLWRKSVFERDDYTCQGCGQRGGYLEADHIKPFAFYPDLRFDLDNGRTMCQPCHHKLPTHGRPPARPCSVALPGY